VRSLRLPRARRSRSPPFKPNKSDAPPGPGWSVVGQTFAAINVPLRTLIRQAYQVQGFQVVGGPSWITSDRFDIVAKTGPPAPTRGSDLMMQSLLAERFKLAAHKETRELPVYALVMAKSDGKPGSQLHQPAVDCYALLRPDAPTPLPTGFFCGGMRPGPGQLSGRMATMKQLILFLSPQVGRIVLDKTGLAGTFDLDLAWTAGPVGPDASGASASLDAGTSIYTSLQEQLGLKLESTKGPVDVLVIDYVEHPIED